MFSFSLRKTALISFITRILYIASTLYPAYTTAMLVLCCLRSI